MKRSSASFGPLTVLFFKDGSCTLMLGWGDGPPLVELGWRRWRPNFIGFPRWRR